VRPRRRRAAVRLRRGRVSDARAVAGVLRAAVRGLAAPFHPRRVVAAWSSLPPLYHAWAMTAGGERYVAASVGDRIVGYAALREDEVTAVFVRPAAARLGVGAALVSRLEREALRDGKRRLRVRAALGALPFYEALGFRGARRIRVPLPDGLALRAVALSKVLAR
jgi:GNAT superfamily N-acetyltransferase